MKCDLYNGFLNTALNADIGNSMENKYIYHF